MLPHHANLYKPARPHPQPLPGRGKAGEFMSRALGSGAPSLPSLPSFPALERPAGTTWRGSLLSALIGSDCSDSVTGLRVAGGHRAGASSELAQGSPLSPQPRDPPGGTGEPAHCHPPMESASKVAHKARLSPSPSRSFPPLPFPKLGMFLFHPALSTQTPAMSSGCHPR